MSSAAVAVKAPLPAEVDARAEAFSELQTEIAGAKKKLQESQKQLSDREIELLALVRSFGGPHATKSKILHGILWEMVATFGKFKTEDSAAVERFRLALVSAKKGRLLKKLFERDVRWTMKSGAGQILAAENLAPRIKADLLGLLLLCSSEQDKKPSLDVRQKKKGS
jgi:hypothetical protein